MTQMQGNKATAVLALTVNRAIKLQIDTNREQMGVNDFVVPPETSVALEAARRQSENFAKPSVGSFLKVMLHVFA